MAGVFESAAEKQVDQENGCQVNAGTGNKLVAQAFSQSNQVEQEKGCQQQVVNSQHGFALEQDIDTKRHQIGDSDDPDQVDQYDTPFRFTFFSEMPAAGHQVFKGMLNTYHGVWTYAREPGFAHLLPILAHPMG